MIKKNIICKKINSIKKTYLNHLKSYYMEILLNKNFEKKNLSYEKYLYLLYKNDYRFNIWKV